MVESPHRDPLEIARRLHEQASADEIRVTVYGHREMVDEDISYEAVREALRDCQVLENYPDHQRGACCLVCGRTGSGRFLHIVCTTTLDVIVIIIVYKPQRPKWVTPFERGGRNEV